MESILNTIMDRTKRDATADLNYYLATNDDRNISEQELYSRFFNKRLINRVSLIKIADDPNFTPTGVQKQEIYDSFLNKLINYNPHEWRFGNFSASLYYEYNSNVNAIIHVDFCSSNGGMKLRYEFII